MTRVALPSRRRHSHLRPVAMTAVERELSQHTKGETTMDQSKLDTAVTYIRDHWHLITGDESEYKPRVAATIRPVFEAVAAGDPAWPELLKKNYRAWSNQVGWRCASAFVEYAQAHGPALSEAVEALRAPSDTDAFWEVALHPVGGRDGLKNGFAQLRAPGTRASLASLVLFSRDHENHPIYRARISGRPLMVLLGEPLDKRTLGTTLVSYYAGLERLKGLLQERGLKPANNLDVQGVLWVLNHNKIV